MTVHTLFKVKIFCIMPLRIGYRFFKPLMLITAMIYHKIEKDIHIPLLRFGNQLIHVLIRTEARVNLIVVGNIVALIRKRGKKTRGNPNDINPQPFQIIELSDNSS